MYFYAGKRLDNENGHSFLNTIATPLMLNCIANRTVRYVQHSVGSSSLLAENCQLNAVLE